MSFGKKLLISKWNCKQKNAGLAVSPGLKSVQNKNGKIRAMRDVECCGSFCRLPTERTKLRKKGWWFLSEIESEKCFGSCADGVHTAKLETENHLRRRKRERMALMAADVWVWVYKSTVYNTKGTTWSGSPLWKQALQEVQQHWFISGEQLVYAQVLYRVDRVRRTGLTVSKA
jgi:hypothetical protein